MVSTNNKKYREEIKKEEALWNKTAGTELKKHPPDYAYYKETLPYKIYRHKYVTKMLSNIQPGDKVLELGCYNGWFSLEMARKGAFVDAHDISTNAIKIGKNYYQKCKKEECLKGTISYFVTDLNYPNFPNNTYDVIVIRNVLHHLTNLQILFYELKKALKNGGDILVDDALPCGKKEALISGILLFLLPTDIPYRQKLKRVFKKGQILKRTQGLVDACGSSPFEGVTGQESVIYLMRIFKQLSYSSFAAFVGTVTAHLKLSNPFKKLLLRFLNFVDIFLIKIGLLRGTIYYLVVKKD